MQCPNCSYAVVGRYTGFPCETHCCQGCLYEPGNHGPRCARILSPYAEFPRVCPSCQQYAVTGVSATHCCSRCGKRPGDHGHKCMKKLPTWRINHELGTPVHYYRLRAQAAAAASGRAQEQRGAHEATRSRQKPTVHRLDPPSSLRRCAYVLLLYGQDMEYAFGALLVAASLRRFASTCEASRPRIVLLHTIDVPPARLPLLQRFFDEVRLIEDPIELPANSPLVSCSRDFAHPQFLKLHLLELDFDKVLYLDCDILIRKNIDELFSLRAPAAMERIMVMPPHGAALPNRVFYGSKRIRGIQGGVMLLKPDRELFQQMRREVEDAHALDGDYVESIGNEQDYLTWRYCHGKSEEDGDDSVWTHLGCEFNCEVHAPSRYFSIGRERWLWMDWETDAAVLHFSAPFRKRAPLLLREQGEQYKLREEDNHPRVRAAEAAWDEEVERLRADIERLGTGESLKSWLGQGQPTHHIGAFAVIDSGPEAGMAIKQLAEGEQPPPSCVLAFEAFTADCADGLKFFPPPFAPGPPWGANFWAPPAVVVKTEEAQETDEDSTGTGSEESDVEIVVSSSEDGHSERASIASPSGEKRVHPGDPSGKEYSYADYVAYALDWGFTIGHAKRLWRQAGRFKKELLEFQKRKRDVPTRCQCAARAVAGDVTPVSVLMCQGVGGTCNGRIADMCNGSAFGVGAWINRKETTDDSAQQWVFGRVDHPPHFDDCPLFRRYAVFTALPHQR